MEDHKATNMDELEKSLKYFLDSLVDILGAGGPPFGPTADELRKFTASNVLDADSIKRQAFNMANSVSEVAERVQRGSVEVKEDGPGQTLDVKNGPKEVTPQTKEHNGNTLRGGAPALFSSVIDHIVSMRPKHYKNEADEIKKLLNSGGALEAILQHVLYLVLQIRQDIVEERSRALNNIVEALSSLEAIEKFFIGSVNASQIYHRDTDSTFTLAMENGLKEIGSMAKPEQTDLETLCRKIASKVSQLHQFVQKKKQDDQTRFEALAAERESAEKRLEHSRRTYEEFSRKSHEMLKEIEVLREVSQHDQLTGIYNRRAYDQQIIKTVDACKSGELNTCGLVVFDIDFFSAFNNNYGHLAGDRVLTYVAKLTKEALRKDELIFRYGGDEFVILVPNSDLKGSVAVAEKVRQSISSVEFKLFKNSDLTVHIGISMGVAEIRPDDDCTTFFNRADQALYAAKANGRNRVCSDPKC